MNEAQIAKVKIFNAQLPVKSKKVCKDQELKQSEPKSSPQNKTGKQPKPQIVKLRREHMVNRVSSYKGDHSETQTTVII